MRSSPTHHKSCPSARRNPPAVWADAALVPSLLFVGCFMYVEISMHYKIESFRDSQNFGHLFLTGG